MAKNPAFLKPVARYVSPRFLDRIFAEDVDSDQPNYKALAPGIAHPDTTKYPSFKLGHQEPLENGKIVRRYWINDRLNQDDYNFEYTYPYYGLSQFPRLKRTYVVPRADYAPPTVTNDPVVTDAIFVGETQTRFDERVLDNLYVLINRVFDVIPDGSDAGASGILTEYGWGVQYPDGDKTKEVLTWNFQIGKDNYSAANELSACPISGYTSLVLIDQAAAPIEGDPNQIKVTRQYARLPGANVDTLQSRGSIDLIPAKFRAASLVRQIRTRVTMPTSPDTPTGNLVESTVQSEKTGSGQKVNIELPVTYPVTLTGKNAGTWGEETVTESLENDNSIVTGYRTTASNSTPIGNGKFVKQKVQVDNPPSAINEIRQDDVIKAIINIQKTLVDPGSSAPIATAHQTVERQAIDKWNSIQIVSTLDTASLPSPETIPGIASFTFPDVLEEIGILWQQDVSNDSGSSGVYIANITDQDGWSTSATASASASIVGAIYTKIKDGHSGPIRTQTIRTYSTSLPTFLPTVTIFQPVRGSVTLLSKGLKITRRSAIAGAGQVRKSSSSGSAFQTSISGQTVFFGPVLHGGVNLVGAAPPATSSVGSAQGGSIPDGNPVSTTATAQAQAFADLKISASSAPPTPSSSHNIAVSIEKWRFGVWVQEVVTGFHP
jgi:hypothetical protein